MNESETWLAIDTTGQGCHVGLYYQRDVSLLSDNSPQSHAKLLLPMIQRLLEQANLTHNNLTGIIYTQGPGSFTGVRIGVSVVQGLALALDTPTLGVSSLLALAWQGPVATGCDRILSVIDARMGQVYCGDYCFGSSWHIYGKDRLLTPAELVIAADIDCVIGDIQVLTMELKQMQVKQSTIQLSELFSLADAGLMSKELKWDSSLALPTYLRHDVAALPKK
jgi:tRNA threonylcarbamoyl adenosine modification protein YeaZ